MHSTSSQAGLWSKRIVVGWAIIMMLSLLIMQSRYGGIPIFHFRFNSYALLSGVGVAVLLIFFYKMRKYDIRNDEAMWFVLCLLALTAFGIGEMFQRLSVHPSAAVFWAQLCGIGTAFEPVGLFLFAVSYVNQRARSVKTIIVVLFAAAFLLFFHANGSLIYRTDPASIGEYPWGYNNDIGAAFVLNALWVAIVSLSAALLMWRFRSQTSNPILRRQSTIYVIAMLMPAGGALMTDVLPPLFGLTVPPMHVFFSTVSSGVILYALYHYQIFKLNPASISQEILDTMSEAVVVVDQDFSIALVNKAAASLLGIRSERATGRSLLEYFTHNHASALRTALLEHPNSKSARIIDDIALVKNGRGTDLRISVSTLGGSTGMRGYILAISDVTELKTSYQQLQHEKAMVDIKVAQRTRQLSEAQTRLLASIAGLQQGFMMTDRKFRIVTMNGMAQKIFQRPHHDSVTLGDLAMSLGKNKSLASQITRSLENRKQLVFNGIQHKNAFYNVFITPIINDDNKVLGNVVLLDDVTEERILQRSKDEFFSIASHELRTPLTAISGNASILLSYYKDFVSKEPDVQSMLQDINQASKNLIEIVSDFLDMSSIEQDKVLYKHQEFELETIVERVVYEMRGQLHQKKLYCNTDTKTLGLLPKLWADPDRTKQVLYNLVGNAMKFTDTGGVTISATKISDDTVKVSVADTGRGISPSNRKLLFHKFQQANDSLLTRDTTRGTGLGLYISKMLIEHMGGRLWLERSESNGGSVFSFTLPIAAPTAKATAAGSATPDVPNAG